MDGSHQNEDTSQDVLIQNTISGGIGTVTLRDTVIHSTDRKFNVSMIGDGAELILDNVTCTAETSNIYIQGQSKLTIRDGRYMLADGGGGNAAGHNVNLTPGCDATELRVEGTPKFEVADKKAAIRLSSATCKAYINGFQADKKAGATSTVGLSHSAGATAKVVTDIRGTVDKLEAGSGTVTYAVYE